jgi:hypothetical protein
MTTYQQAKQQLKEIAHRARAIHKHDKPAQRQDINDSADYLGRELRLSEARKNQLANYACKLHP